MLVEFTAEERERALEAESSDEQQIEAENEQQIEAEDEQQIEAENKNETQSGLKEDSEQEDVEDDTIPFTYYDETEGENKVVNMSYDRLSRIVEDYMRGRSIEEDAQRMAEYLQQVNPLIERFNQSDILRQIVYYQSQGYDDDTIKKGLVKLWGSEVTGGKQLDKTPEFESPQDEINYYIEKQIEKRLEHYLKPYQAKISELANTMTYETIEKANNKVLAKALERYNITEENLTKEDIDAFNKALMDAYPNIDLRRHPLTQQQAYIVANEAFRHRKSEKTPEVDAKYQKIKNALKQATAPSIIPGKRARQSTGGLVNKLDGYSDAERRKNWVDLIS